jgi:hypothetical protein
MKILNFFTCLIILIVIEIFLGFYFTIGKYLFILTLGGSLFVYAKMNVAFILCQGHGVFQPKKFKIWGFTVGKLIYFSVIALLLGALLTLSYKTHGLPVQDTLNMRYVPISLTVAFVLSLVLWRFYWYDKTYYCSEYDARLGFRQTNYSSENIETKIKKLKECKL